MKLSRTILVLRKSCAPLAIKGTVQPKWREQHQQHQVWVTLLLIQQRSATGNSINGVVSRPNLRLGVCKRHRKKKVVEEVHCSHIWISMRPVTGTHNIWFWLLTCEGALLFAETEPGQVRTRTATNRVWFADLKAYLRQCYPPNRWRWWGGARFSPQIAAILDHQRFENCWTHTHKKYNCHTLNETANITSSRKNHVTYILGTKYAIYISAFKEKVPLFRAH